nr:IPT/TIG domain-containing protein [Candidatus Acidoferrales bacterium]
MLIAHAPASSPIPTDFSIAGKNIASQPSQNSKASPVRWLLSGACFLFLLLICPLPSFAQSPSVTGFSPVSAAGVGFPLYIGGSGFGATQGSSTITFNGVAATVQYWSDSQIQTIVPTGATTGPVVVTVGGVASNGLTFTVTTTPLLTGFSPTASGGVGTTVLVGGSNLGATQGSSTVTFNGVSAGTSSYWSNDVVYATVPAGATTGPVVITVGGIASNGLTYTVVSTPQISGLSPVSAAGVGFPLYIGGSNFGATQGSSTITFNGVAATVQNWSNTQIQATVPTGATTGPIVVTVAGVASNGFTFTVTTAPLLTGFGPGASASVGSQVIIGGSNFGATQGSSTITFNGVSAGVSPYWSVDGVYANVPTGATTGPVVVTVGGVASNGLTFTVVAPPIITATASPAPNSSGWNNSPVTVTFTCTPSSGGAAITSCPSPQTVSNEGANQVISGTVRDAAFGNASTSVTVNLDLTSPQLAISSPLRRTTESSSSLTVTGTVGDALSGLNTVTCDGVQATFGGGNFSCSLSLSSARTYVAVTATDLAGNTTTSNVNVGLAVPGTSTPTGNLDIGRSFASSTLLTNGQVLIAGGYLANSNVAATAVLYNPRTGIFTPTGEMTTPRASQMATLLNNGMVLITGGYDVNGNPLVSAELYDPVASVFTATGNMSTTRGNHTATLLPDGTVLIAGGFDSNFNALASAELYNLATGTFTAVGSLSTARAVHSGTLLNNGQVVVIGGNDSNGNPIATAEFYNPTSRTFTATSTGLSIPRAFHSANLLNNGKVLIAGGIAAGSTSTATAEIFDPTVGTFSATGSMSVPRVFQNAVLLNNSTVLIAGGADFAGTIYSSIESYDPVAQTFSASGNLTQGRSGQSASLLLDGTVLVAGGADNSFPFASAEVYDPATLNPPNLVSVAVTPASPSISVGTAQQFTATGTFSDGSTQVLSSATWISSDHTIATMTSDATNRGQAFAVAAGTAIVKACAGSAYTHSFATANVNGTFGDGTTLTGTLTIDTTAGTITDASLATTGAEASTFTFANYLAPYSGPDGPTGYAANFNNGSIWLELVLFTSTGPDGMNGTLVNYTGGPFCNTQSGCGDTTAVYDSDTNELSAITSGAITSTPAASYCGSVTLTVNAAGLNITDLTPASGPVGTPVIIAGTGFGATQGSSTVAFNGTTATVGLWSNTAIVTSVPVGAVTGSVVVSESGVNSNGFVFNVSTGPVITSLSPSSGNAGTSVTITGSNFGMTQGASTVTFNGTAATPSSWSNTSIVASVPANATTGNVVVTVSGAASNGVQFAVPSISEVSPNSGAIGELITILGSGFGATQGSGTVSINSV